MKFQNKGLCRPRAGSKLIWVKYHLCVQCKMIYDLLGNKEQCPLVELGSGHLRQKTRAAFKRSHTVYNIVLSKTKWGSRRSIVKSFNKPKHVLDFIEYSQINICLNKHPKIKYSSI